PRQSVRERPARGHGAAPPGGAGRRVRRRMLEKRAVARRNGEEERGALLDEDAPRPLGGKRLGRQHRRASGGEREIETSTEAVREEQLGGRVRDVVWPDLEQ